MMDAATLKDPRVLRHSVLDFRQMSAFVQSPLIFDRAEGVHYWDIDGKHYYDGISGIFNVGLGHGNQRVIKAITDQLNRLCFAPPLHGANSRAIELCARLAEIAPGDLNTVKLVSSGSEATEVAMKVCRQYWKQAGKPTKYKIISRYYGYHGATMGALAATGTPARRVPFEPYPTGYIHIPTVHCYRCPYEKSYPECRVFCAEYLRQVIALEGPDTVAAFIVEPIGNTGGILVPPPEYLPIIRRICDEFDVLLIYDEMITGMGRTGKMFGAETFGVTPDILCLGKGLSSGYAPLAAAIWSDRVQEAFWGPEEAHIEFGHGHTYAGNPVCAAAGLACIDEILERDLISRANELGAHLRMRLGEMAERYGIFGEVRGKGLLWGIELARDPSTREPFDEALRVGKRIGAVCQEGGLIIRHDPDWFAMAPPLTSTVEQVDAMCAILDASIAQVMEEL